jgi:small ligand-binding sensory domain FIST
MHWASAICELSAPEALVEELGAQVQAALGGREVHLLLLLVSEGQPGTLPALAPLLRRRFPGARLVGACSGGVLASGREIEGRHGVALVAAHLPEVELRLLAWPAAAISARIGRPRQIVEELGWEREMEPSFLIFGEAQTCPAELVLATLDQAYPSGPRVGGLVGQQGGEPSLWVDDGPLQDGLVALAMVGDLQMQPLVAQGARPAGPTFLVEEAHHNLILRASGQSGVGLLEQGLAAMSPEDQQLFRRSPMIGLAPLDGAGRRDFLVRNLIGVDRGHGRLAVGAPVKPGLQVQLFVRDAQRAREELGDLLRRARRHAEPRAALNFTCLGRGSWFYGESEVESALIRQALGPLPLAGAFCQGEIGPQHGRSVLYGYTSTMALLSPRGWS